MEQIKSLERLLNEEEARIAGPKLNDPISEEMRRAIDDTRNNIRKVFSDDGKQVKARLKTA